MTSIKELKQQQKKLIKEIKTVEELALQNKLVNKNIIPFRIFKIISNNIILGYFFLINVKNNQCTIMKINNENYENFYARVCVKTMYIKDLLNINTIIEIKDCKNYKEACLNLFEIFIEKNKNKFDNIIYTSPVNKL